jgi:subtilisin-like proprotein convertase family protein
LLTGTFQPDARNTSPLTVLANTGRTDFLSSFNGLDPNGDWTLFVADVSGGDTHTLVSWGLEATGPIPEPGTTTLLALGGLGLLLAAWRRKQS